MVKTIAFASGKGGVGKTSIAVNCAIKLQLGRDRVALLDADFGMANSHIMMNQKIEKSLYDLIENDVDLASIVCKTASGLKLIPGGAGVIELLDLSSEKRFEFTCNKFAPAPPPAAAILSIFSCISALHFCRYRSSATAIHSSRTIKDG